MLTMLGLTRKLANGHLTSMWRGYSKQASTFKGPILRRAQVPEPEYEDKDALEQATEMEAKSSKQQQQHEADMGSRIPTTEKVQVAMMLPLYMEAKHMRPVTAVEGVRLEGNAEKEKLAGDYHMYSYYDLNEMAMHYRNEAKKKKN